MPDAAGSVKRFGRLRFVGMIEGMAIDGSALIVRTWGSPSLPTGEYYARDSSGRTWRVGLGGFPDRTGETRGHTDGRRIWEAREDWTGPRGPVSEVMKMGSVAKRLRKAAKRTRPIELTAEERAERDEVRRKARNKRKRDHRRKR